jgi:hypothetical protein
VTPALGVIVVVASALAGLLFRHLADRRAARRLDAQLRLPAADEPELPPAPPIATAARAHRAYGRFARRYDE